MPCGQQTLLELGLGPSSDHAIFVTVPVDSDCVSTVKRIGSDQELLLNLFIQPLTICRPIRPGRSRTSGERDSPADIT